MFVAYVVVLVPSIVVDILYSVSPIVFGDAQSFDKMPTRYAVVVRLAIEYKSVGDVIDIEKASSYWFVAGHYELAVKMHHSNAQTAFHGEDKLWHRGTARTIILHIKKVQGKWD